MSFVHLHCHTHYSLLDGLPKPEAYVKKAVEHGSPALAITDHGNMYGAIKFYQIAKKAGIKPIIGIEAYTALGSRHSKQAGIDNKIGHIILLARNNKGYENLMALTTKANLEGFYYKPRIDQELMEEHSEGLILLTGCLNGDLSKAHLANDAERSQEVLTRYQTVFGKENVYLELQDHPRLMEQGILNERLIDMSSRTGAPLVATNDCHFLDLADKEAHDVLLCVQTGTNINDEGRFKIDGNISMRSPEEMMKAFEHVPQAISNTVEIANQCEINLELNTNNLLPSFETPDNKSEVDYLRELCEDGMHERYGEKPTQEVLDRLDYELGMINQMGFDAYFLIVYDFVAFAKKSGILVGPGRGSAAGALIAYCLGITDVDPIRYKLIFERFLNPARVSMPDIDIDFADNRREDVLEYVVEKYGKDKVAQIITFGTMAAKAAIRDVGRGLGMAYSDVDAISKMIPTRPGIKLREALESEHELRSLYQSDPAIKRLITLALKLEGVVRHASVHACAVVISDRPLVEYTPLQNAPRSDGNVVITQYDMHDIEAIGLLKMDFLGLKNLTILQYAIEIISRTKGVDIDLDELPIDDAKTFELMARGETTGVFQFESAGMRRYLRELKPTLFEDLIAMNALYRPGPMDWIPAYIEGKHDETSVKYLHDSFEPILKETHGVAVYQEQILQLAQLVAGFSLGEADILRKAVGKKIIKLLNQQRKKFIAGAVEKGHTDKFAKDVFEKVIEPFAGYGFNKAHATCYALIAYRTAYLKSHYPAEFMAALMTSDRDNTDRLIIEFNEAEMMGIQILPPSINQSMANFTVVDDDTIRFGLAAIKGVGIGTVREIISIREKDGPFTSIDDLSKRVPYSLLNKKTLEALAYCGALDDLVERRALIASIEELARFARVVQTSSIEGQSDIFSMLDDDDCAIPPFELAKVAPASRLQKLQWEKNFLGFYVSGHPLQGLLRYLQRKVTLITSFNRNHVSKPVRVAGIITQIRKVTTKKGAMMAYLTLEDPTSRIEVTVFPYVYNQFKQLLEAEAVVLLTGKLELRRSQIQLMCQGVQNVSLEAMISRAKESGVFDPDHRVKIQASHMIEPEPVVAKAETPEVKDKAPSVTPSVSKSPPSAPAIQERRSLDDPFVIQLKGHQTAASNLKELKSILLSHQGKQLVEIHISQNGMLKRIKVPFGVKISPDLKTRIAELATIA